MPHLRWLPHPEVLLHEEPADAFQEVGKIACQRAVLLGVPFHLTIKLGMRCDVYRHACSINSASNSSAE